jgi:hypothetical protein
MSRISENSQLTATCGFIPASPAFAAMSGRPKVANGHGTILVIDAPGVLRPTDRTDFEGYLNQSQRM